MKNLVASVNIISLLVLGYLLLTNKGHPGEYLFMFVLVSTPILNLYYLYFSKPKGESLFSLWLSVRKKKLKDELKDND